MKQFSKTSTAPSKYGVLLTRVRTKWTPSLARECVKYLDGNMEQLDALDVLTYARQLNDEEISGRS